MNETNMPTLAADDLGGAHNKVVGIADRLHEIVVKQRLLPQRLTCPLTLELKPCRCESGQSLWYAGVLVLAGVDGS